MDCYETSSQDPVSKQVTTIRVNIAKNARKTIEELVENSEEMIRRCVWRFIALKHEDGSIKGDVDNFTIEPDKILELFRDLRNIDSKKN